MKKVKILAVIVCVMTIVNFASAEIIRGINIDFATVGNPGNVADTGGTPGCGAVSYGYRIGKYEITNFQWNAFTAAAGAPTGNPGYAYDQDGAWPGDQKPKAWVSWYEAAQFCNWLTSGNKSLGAYQLGTDGSITVDRDAAISSYGIAYVLPTEDEWYKAAYFKPNGSGYSLYAYGTDTAPIAGLNSNYYGAIGSPWNVGFGTQEQNGTFDMMGNVWEWNETLLYGSVRGIRGGSYGDGTKDDLPSSLRYYYYYVYGDSFAPNYENGDLGFRVASVPEPATILLLSLGGLILRKKH